MLSAYRRTGADPPFGDPLRPHGVAMEGWFWRLTQPATGTVVVALAGINRDRHGRSWGTVGLAAHPGGFAASAALPGAQAHPDGTLVIGDALRARPGAVELRLGPETCLDVTLEAPVRWPRRAFGGLGAAQTIPGLSQYWHPWLLQARVRGHAQAGGREIDLDGAVAYAEKNWSNGGFPDRWWWGQAHGFDDPGTCVAFAGGSVGVGALHGTAGSLVVRAGGEVHRLIGVGGVPGGLRVGMDDGAWRLAGRGAGGATIEVEGHANGTAPHRLPIPVPAEGRNLQDAAAQHLAGHLALTVRRRGRTVYAGTSVLAGLERGTAAAVRPR